MYDFSIVYKRSSYSEKLWKVSSNHSITKDEGKPKPPSDIGRVTMAPTETSERTVGKTDWLYYGTQG